MQRQLEDQEGDDQDAMNVFGPPLQTDADFEQMNVLILLLADKATRKCMESYIVY